MAGREPTVAVIGLGAQGLVTLKNLLEQGFNVTGFDRNDYIGGLWHYCAEHRISVLPSTVVNSSRERTCFTDFAFPEGTSPYPTATEIDQYLNAYCDNFNLRPHLRLSTGIQSIQRDNVRNGWLLTVQSTTSTSTETLFFEKLVMALGPHSRPNWPSIQDSDKFKGKILHSIQFKGPSNFKGKRVMVVGVSNTAADTSTSLVNVADKVYLGHRDGAVVVPRYLKSGKSLDHDLTYRTGLIKDILEWYFPVASRKFLDSMISKISQSEFGAMDPAWRLEPRPSLLHQVPTVSETLVPSLRQGNIVSTAAPKRIVGDYDVELDDGTVVQVDSIICCTGYRLDLSILGEHDPTLTEPGQHSNLTPQLYQNMFSLQYPHSLAFVGIAITLLPAFIASDLSTMALAQLWSTKPGSPSLPAQIEMEKWYAEHLKWVAAVRSISPRGKFVKLSVQQGTWINFIQTAAGTNIEENLGYGSLQAWRYWLSNPRFCKLLMDGIWSPHVYRLFESDRRKTWPGARSAIERVNDTVAKERNQRKQLVIQQEKGGKLS